ncbi:MAG: hypothetical protein MK132_14610 [Lentisphaerales bacterium]|nr:hypothetical protein [Lentisphaerales bacterium]
MENHNILGKKAEASAALKEKIISLIAWIFILFCICLVVYLSKVGLKALFLNSNKHFTLKNIEITAKGLPDNIQGLVNIEGLKSTLNLHPNTDNLFELDLKRIRRLVNRNVAVKSSEVCFIFPDTLKIDFVEKEPIARFFNSNLIDKEGEIIPKGRNDLILPIIMGETYSQGQKVEDEKVLTPLNFIRFHEGFALRYDQANEIYARLDLPRRPEIAALEIIKIKMIGLNDDNTLAVILHASPNFLVVDNARLKLPADDFEVGLRRACIAIIQNALVRKETNKVDARYNSTPTE